jgi:hypothetical protein
MLGLIVLLLLASQLLLGHLSHPYLMLGLIVLRLLPLANLNQ